MLTALLSNGSPITTVNFTREELKGIRITEHDHFYCPICSYPLILRIGTHKIPHFAHMSKSQCELASENETPLHLESKKIMYERLKQLFSQVYLEYYLRKSNQIADIFIQTNDYSIAVEIQCSSIPISDLVERTKGYQRQNIIPFWVLTQTVKRNSLLKISSFQQAFIRFSPELKFYLLYFHPDKKCFFLFTHLTPVSANSFISSAPIKIPIQQFILPIKINPTDIHLPSVEKEWSHQRMRWIQTQLSFSNRKNNHFLREVYSEGDTILYLPLFIGLPVNTFSMLIKTHVVQWQYYIWIDVIKKHRSFTKNMIIEHFNKRIKNGSIVLRTFPLINGNKEKIKSLLFDYIFQLEQIKVIQKVSENHYTTLLKWKCPAVLVNMKDIKMIFLVP